MNANAQNTKGKVGLFAIGLAAYWDQFPGLKERLESYLESVYQRLSQITEVSNGGLIDDAPKAAMAGERFARERVELLVCYTATYATSSQVLPAVQTVKAPVLILNLQPTGAIDYAKTDTGEWLANCSACCVPEISCAFARCRIDFRVVTGVLGIENGRYNEAPPSHPDSTAAWKEIENWIAAASAVGRLKKSRIGFLGHTYPGMLDMYSDFTQHTAQLGTHIEVLEMCDLAARLPEAGAASVKTKREEAESTFEISEDSPSDPLAKKPTEDEMLWACRVAVALDVLVSDFDLHGLSYYYRGWQENDYERLAAGMILGCSLLTARGVPASGEGDLKNCQAMKIMDLTGCGGSYTEFYVIDFDENFLLMGHDGPFHLAIAEGKPILRGLGLYHGKRGFGVSVEARVKLGPVTILTVTQTSEGRLKMLAAEGESIPGPTLAIGNTNSRIVFPGKVTGFVNRWCHEGPTHHCALGVGHNLSTLRNIAALLDVSFVEIKNE